MGCQSSMCTDTGELLLSQPLGGKLSDITIPASEKSTSHSTNSLQKRDSEKTNETSRKFNLLKSVVKILLKDLDNYSDIVKISEVWVSEIQKAMEDSNMLPDDLKTTLSLDSQGCIVTIKHELDGLRSFDIIKGFYSKIKFYIKSNKSHLFDNEHYQYKEDFLVSLCPLTISFYLKLSHEIDFGIGVEKPIDRKQMAQFLSNCNEAASISKWTSLSNQPIPTGCSFSVLSQSRFLNFYIFDGLRNQNVDRGLSLFETFGAPVSTEIGDFFRISKADEVNCKIEIDEVSVKSISLQIQTTDLCENVLNAVDPNSNSLKWKAFQSLVPARSLAIELNSEGFIVNKISLL
jgi:hypothetical protein